jgi:hypothetical protein
MFLFKANFDITVPSGRFESPSKYNFWHPLSIASAAIVSDILCAPSMKTRVKA